MTIAELTERLAQTAAQTGERETPVESAMANLGLERKEAIKVLQRAEKRNLGRFVVGRGHHKTRIVWHQAGEGPLAPMQSTVGALGGQKFEQSQMHDPRPCVDHVFPLDKALDIRIRLPRDLTKIDAERIARFVHSLARDV